MTHYGNTVHACECNACGVTFDFRAEDGIKTGKCPICGVETGVRASWNADDGGYHISREIILHEVATSTRLLKALELLMAPEYDPTAKQESVYTRGAKTTAFAAIHKVWTVWPR